MKRQASASLEEGMSIESASSGLVLFNSVTVLIGKVTKMASKATIEADLCGVSSNLNKLARDQSPQILDEFMERIADSDKYLEQGILSFSFAEAAMLLQTSADLYSKKVDLLWDHIFEYQKRMLLADGQEEDKEREMEKLEERKRKYKRKRRLNADQLQTSSLMKQLSWGDCVNTDYLNKQYDVYDLWQEWNKFGTETDENTSHLLTPETSFHCLFQPSDAIHNSDNEYIGRYDQFHSANIISDIFDLESRKLLPDERGSITRMRMDCHVINDFLRENPVLNNQPRTTYTKQLNNYINDFFESRKQHQNESICILQQQLRRYSCAADSGLEEDRFSSISSHCLSPQLVRNKSISQDSAFEEETPPDLISSKIRDSGYLSFTSQEDGDSDHCDNEQPDADSFSNDKTTEKRSELIPSPRPVKVDSKVNKARKAQDVNTMFTELSMKSTVILTRNKRPLPWAKILKEGTMDVSAFTEL